MRLFKDRQEAIEFGKINNNVVLANVEFDSMTLNDVTDALMDLEQRFYKEGNYGKQTKARVCRMYLDSMRSYLIEARSNK